MNFTYNDGGRAKAGYKGISGDCCCRAFAIASGKPYQEVYDLVNECAKGERKGKRKHYISSARDGVSKDCAKKVAERLGFVWVPLMKIGTGCKVHLNAEELPKGKTIVASIAHHFTCVVDGVINDTFNCSIVNRLDEFGNKVVEEDKRCVYGYFVKV